MEVGKPIEEIPIIALGTSMLTLLLMNLQQIQKHVKNNCIILKAIMLLAHGLLKQIDVVLAELFEKCSVLEQCCRHCIQSHPGTENWLRYDSCPNY